MAHPSVAAGVAIIAGVATLSLLLTVLAWAAWRRTRNAKLLFVAAAFAVFFAKGAVTAYSIPTGFLHHEDLELLGSVLDLAVLALLVAPFLRR